MAGYNERLFSGEIRGFLHRARFRWLKHVAANLDCSTVFELGCFDAKSIDQFPSMPVRYVGADAGWEGGLERARERFPQYEFHQCLHPADIAPKLAVPFTLSLAMETFEHIPPDSVSEYLDMLAEVTRGHLVVTVPVEFGPVFLGKHTAKRLSGVLRELDGEIASYSSQEVINATLGRTHRVRRNEHKGFDYRWLRDLIAERFDILECGGHPFGALPAWLNFGVGILAASRGLAQ